MYILPTFNVNWKSSKIRRSFLWRPIANTALTLHLVLLSDLGCIKILKLDSASENPVTNQGFSLFLEIKVEIRGLVNYFNLLEVGKLIPNNSVNAELNAEKKEEKYIYYTKSSVNLQIVKTSDIINVIIPFFEKYPIQGMKSLDFSDFKKISKIIKTKDHLSLEGYNKILKIKSGMNLGRKS